MDFAEMMKSRKDALIAENKQLDADCKYRMDELETEIKDLQEELAELIRQEQALGFFQIAQKKATKALIEKYTYQIAELERRKDTISAQMNARIESNRAILTIINGQKGERVSFGTAPYSGGREPLQWAIVSCDNQQMRLICMCNVGLASYGIATKWLCSDFLREAFSEEERSIIVADPSVPTASEANTTGNMHVMPTNALRVHVRTEEEERGRRYYYNSLQIQNSIKSALERCEPYWLVTDQLRDGFANYVGSSVDGSSWFAARIGACADFGIRPVISVDRFELIKMQG